MSSRIIGETPVRATAEELRPYIGQWVAVKDGKVVAARDTIGELVDYLLKNKLVQNDSLFRVPIDPREDNHK
jgi:hypothetical protein